MKTSNKLRTIVAVFTVAILTACGGNQIEEANHLVDKANKNIVEADELLKKTEKKNKELFAVPIQTEEELQIYKEKKSAEAGTIIEDFEKASNLAESAANQFAEAGKLNVPENFKEYLEIKSQEFAKRAEAVETRKGNAQAFLDYDGATMVKKFEENNEKSEKLMKEAKELGERADEVQRTIND